MIDVIISIVEWILEFIADFFGNLCQSLAGIIFNTMDKFMSGNQNIIIKILSPVYNFSINYLIPFCVALLIFLLVWNLTLTMFGKYSTSRDEPIVLLVRGAIFGVLICLSPLVISAIGGTTGTNGDTEPGIVIQLTSTLLDVGTDNDADGTTKIVTKENNNGKNIKKTLAKGMDKITNFIGFSSERTDGDTGSKYTATKNGKTTINDVASAFFDVSTNNSLSGFTLHFIGLLAYAVIYGLLILIIAWKCLKICSRFIYRFVIFLVLLYFCPLAFTCAPSKSTQRIFSEWLRMLVSYSVLLALTAIFMRLSTFIVFNAFHYSATSDLVQVVFAFLVAIFFLKMTYELERYIEKLGLTAVGLPDSVSGLSGLIAGSVGELRHSLTREGTKMALDKLKGTTSKPDFSIKSPSEVKDESIIDAFSQGSAKYDNEGNEINPLSQDVLGKENDNAFVSDPSGDNIMGSDGIMHNESEFEKDEDGNMVLKANNDIIAENTSQRYSVADAGINTENVNGLDDTSNAFTNVSDLENGSALISSDDGNYYMAETPDGNVAIRKTDLDDNNTTEYAITTDNNGNFAAKEWSSDLDGDKYRLGKDGNLVNIGSGESYSYGNARTEGSVPVKYETSSNGSKCISAKSGRIESMAKYNKNLPKGSKISAINNLEYCSTLYKAKDGTTTGIARQRLVDSDGKPTGQTRYVKFTRYDNTEISKDEIARHRKATNRAMSDRNPCEGYTPDGKHYIHIEKYMGERKKSTIQGHRGPIVRDKAQ